MNPDPKESEGEDEVGHPLYCVSDAVWYLAWRAYPFLDPSHWVVFRRRPIPRSRQIWVSNPALKIPCFLPHTTQTKLLAG
jgi:hypothetical protein